MNRISNQRHHVTNLSQPGKAAGPLRCLNLYGALRRYRLCRIEQLEARCLLTGIELISIDTTGDSAGGLPLPLEFASNPAVNATGRFVAFQSDATDLITGLVDTNGDTDVFVRDRLLGITIAISIVPGVTAKTGDARSFDPSISDDGRFIAFGSAASDLVTGSVIIDAPVNVFVRDRDKDEDGIFDEVEASETRLLSLNGLLTGDGSGVFGGPSGGSAFGFGVENLRPRISGNGKFVTFGSFADNLTLGITDINFTTDIFRVPTFGGAAPTMISDDFDGGFSGGNGEPLPASDSPDISRDGMVVAFVSEANNLIKDAEVGTEDDIYAHNFVTRTTSLVSMNFDRTDGGDADSGDPDLSNDGRYVVWESTATNLVAPGVNTNGTVLDVYRRRLPGGPTELVSVNIAGKTGDGPSENPSISDSGRFVAFESEATDLISDPVQLAAGVVDTNGDADIYVRDMLFKTTALVSINAAGTAAGVGFTTGVGGSSINPVISGSGRYVVFESFAEDLVAGLTLAGRNLFVRDLVTGTTRLVSADIGGDTADDAPNPISSTFQQQITADGSVIALTGFAPDLVTTDTNGSPDGFVSIGTPDLVAVSATSSTSASGRIAFVYTRIFPSLIGPFEIGFYRSADELFDDGDGAPLFTRSAVGLSATLAGFVYTLGPAMGLPGAGAPEDDEDYSLLAVVDHLDTIVEDDAEEINEDNTTAFVADYQLKGMPWMVHGTSGSDVISYSLPTSTSLELDFNARSRTLPLADVPTTRVRAHGGDDTVIGSPLDDFIHGGDGDDTLFGGDGDDMIADGPGDDTVDGGLGDDIIISTPGSDDVFIDGGGIDTLDFSLDDQPITLDLDSTAIQTVDPLGNTVRLDGQWENFVGSPLGNTVYVRPLAMPRTIVGSGGNNDQLVFDAMGLSVTFDGTRFIIPGFGDVTVGGFEIIQTINAAPRTIDDGDPGYADTGFGFVDVTQGFNSDVRFSAANSGNTATWNFVNLAPGIYAVSATWTFAGDRAKNSLFTIRDGGPTGTIVSTVQVNQEQNPGEFDPPDDGQNILFRNLGIVRITGNELTVQLTDIAADQFVAADAIRIQPIEVASRIIDDGDLAYAGSGFVSQVLASNATNRGAFGDAQVGQDVGDAANYSFGGLTPGKYVVSATWTAAGDRATNAPLNAQATSSQLDTSVNQQFPPDDFVEGGISWERLGEVTVDPDGILTVYWRVLSQTTGTVIADAVRVDPAPQVEAFECPPSLLPIDTLCSEFRGQPADGTFGDVPSGTAATTTFVVQNTGTARLQVNTPIVTGTGFSLAEDFQEFLIQPGGIVTFDVRFSSATTGSFAGQLRFPTNVFGLNPFDLDLTANVVDDSTPPTVSISSPPDGTTAILSATIPIRAEAMDDVGLQRVEFRVNGQLAATDTTSPYGFDFNPAVDGLHVVSASAVDFHGNSTSSTSIDVNLLPDRPPIVEIVSPRNGDVFMSGQSIVIRAEAVDDVAIQRVEFLSNGLVVDVVDSAIDGMFVGQIPLPLNLTSVQLQARAIDSAGNIETSEVVELIIQEFPWHNYRQPLDVNDNNRITPTDALIIINLLNSDRPRILNLQNFSEAPPYYDTNASGNVTPSDALLVINFLNTRDSGGEGESGLKLNPLYVSNIALQSPLIESERGRIVRSVDSGWERQTYPAWPRERPLSILRRLYLADSAQQKGMALIDKAPYGEALQNDELNDMLARLDSALIALLGEE